MFYSKSTGGFYDESIHGARTLTVVRPGWEHPTVEVPDPAWDVAAHPDEPHPSVMIPDPTVTPPTVEIVNPATLIPADAVEITMDEHAALLAGQDSGKRITADIDGRPMLSDRPPPTEAEAAATARLKRSELLSACDWTQARDIPEAISAAWAPYRQSLRDITEQPGFPRTITWPEPPK